MKSVPSVYGESIWLKKNEKPVFALNAVVVSFSPI